MMRNKIIFCAFLLFDGIFLSFGQQKTVFKTGKIAPLKTGTIRLFLAGSFNNWNPRDQAWEMKPDESGSYRITAPLSKGPYAFKITRGSWETVECTASGEAIENRLFNISRDTAIVMNIDGWQDNYTVPIKKHTSSAQVHIINEKFEIPQLGRQRRVWIYLPEGYKSTKRRYPVIYMHDGQNLFDAYTAGFGEWGIDEMLDKLSEKKECIVIGIDHGGDYRITEYDPYDSKYGKGRGSDYVDFIAKTLKPFIDAHYRTKPDAMHTTIAGSSMGGLISMYAGLKYPDVFGNAGIFSPAFWIAPDIYGFAQRKNIPGNTRFYFVCGDAESDNMVADMKKMAAIVKEKHLHEDPPVVIIKGATHSEKQWNADFPGFYSWLLKGF